MRVIARAYGGEPLQRVATGSTETLTYVLHPSVASAVGTKPFSGVGFPRNDVFVFDLTIFESLCRAWDTDNAEQLAQIWRQATLAPPVAMAAA